MGGEERTGTRGIPRGTRAKCGSYHFCACIFYFLFLFLCGRSFSFLCFIYRWSMVLVSFKCIFLLTEILCHRVHPNECTFVTLPAPLCPRALFCSGPLCRPWSHSRRTWLSLLGYALGVGERKGERGGGRVGETLQ